MLPATTRRNLSRLCAKARPQTLPPRLVRPAALLSDGDALPDPHWLRYLALRFMEHHGNSTWAAVGGRSLAPLGYGTVADSLAYAPGEPGEGCEGREVGGGGLGLVFVFLVGVGGGPYHPLLRVANARSTCVT